MHWGISTPTLEEVFLRTTSAPAGDGGESFMAAAAAALPPARAADCPSAADAPAAARAGGRAAQHQRAQNGSQQYGIQNRTQPRGQPADSLDSPGSSSSLSLDSHSDDGDGRPPSGSPESGSHTGGGDTLGSLTAGSPGRQERAQPRQQGGGEARRQARCFGALPLMCRPSLHLKSSRLAAILCAFAPIKQWDAMHRDALPAESPDPVNAGASGRWCASGRW